MYQLGLTLSFVMKNLSTFQKQEKVQIMALFEPVAKKIFTTTLKHFAPLSISWLELSQLICIYDRLVFPNKNN